MKRNHYNRLKEAARTEAFEWQLTSGDYPMSYTNLQRQENAFTPSANVTAF